MSPKAVLEQFLALEEDMQFVSRTGLGALINKVQHKGWNLNSAAHRTSMVCL